MKFEFATANRIIFGAGTSHQMLTGNASATHQDGVQWVQTLCTDLQIPGLSTYGLRLNDLTAVVDKSKNSSSMKGNPILLHETELTHILRQAL